jgi:hypothetical protein
LEPVPDKPLGGEGGIESGLGMIKDTLTSKKTARLQKKRADPQVPGMTKGNEGGVEEE